MGQIYLRLYEELNDYLPAGKRKRTLAYPLDGDITVEGLLKRLAVPESEVELVLVNGVSSDFCRLLRDGDFISLYPVFESFDVTSLLRVRKEALRQMRFMAGEGLERLAVYLHLLGLDTIDCSSWTLESIIRVTQEERRILLAKDSFLPEARALSRVYFVKAGRPGEQLLEVLSRFDLYASAHFSVPRSPILNHR